LGLDGPSAGIKHLKTAVPKQVLPYCLHGSRFKLHRLSMESGEAPRAAELNPADNNDFLLIAADYAQLPVMVGRPEIKLLSRIDGRRSLKDVVKKIEETEIKRALSFIGFLVRNQVIELTRKGQHL
jgi:hypothetical protein